MNLFRHSMTLTLASLCLVALPSFLRAQDSSADNPAAIISLKNIDGQLDDVKFLGTAAGYGDQVGMVPMLAQGYLQGIDTEKPLGAVVWFEGQEPRVVGMVPVTDIEAVLDQVSAFGMNVDEEGDFYFLEGPNADIVLTVKEGYAFLSDSKEHLAAMPGTPETLLKGVVKDHMLAAKLFVQRIPAELRDMAVDQMREGFENAMEEMDNGDLEELQRETNAMQMQQLIDMVQNSDQLEIGWGVDQSAQKLIFDMSFTGLEGSKIAKQAAAMEGKSSKFGKFLVDSAAMNMNGFGVLLEEDKQNLKNLLESVKATAMEGMEDEGDMTEDEKQVATDLVTDMFDLFNSSIDAGFVDFGGTILMDKGTMNLVAGGSLADASKFDSLVEKMTNLATSQQEVEVEAEKVKINGVSFDKLIVTLPEDVDAEVKEMLGDKVAILLGRTGEEAYFAAGTSPEAAFETIMGNSSSNSEFPVVYNVRVLPILKFVSNNEQAAPVVEKLLNDYSSENDRISVFSKVIPNGQQFRGEMDSDLLQLIGSAIQAQQQMQMGGPGADF